MRKRSTCTKIVELSISVLPTKLGIGIDSILCHLYFVPYQIKKILYHLIYRNLMTKRNWCMWEKLAKSKSYYNKISE